MRTALCPGGNCISFGNESSRPWWFVSCLPETVKRGPSNMPVSTASRTAWPMLYDVAASNALVTPACRIFFE